VTPQPPSLAQQIEAVQWAALHLDRKQKLDQRTLRTGEADEIRRRLEAAAETLNTMEFARETLK
jgi:hypothetical protein